MRWPSTMRCRCYGLVDPRDGRVRYVGCSLYPHLRFRKHATNSDSKRVRAWVDELRARGLKPNLALLPRADERAWIARLHPDLNRNPGIIGRYELGQRPGGAMSCDFAVIRAERRLARRAKLEREATA